MRRKCKHCGKVTEVAYTRETPTGMEYFCSWECVARDIEFLPRHANKDCCVICGREIVGENFYDLFGLRFCSRACEAGMFGALGYAKELWYTP